MTQDSHGTARAIRAASGEFRRKHDSRRPKVLMLGPGTGVTGGIAGLVQTILPELRRHTELVYVPTVEDRPLRDSGKLSIRNVRTAASQYARFLRQAVAFRPEIVHLHTSQGVAWLKDSWFVIASKALRCRSVVHVHGGSFDRFHDRSARVLQRFTSAVLARADAVIAVSDDLRRRLARIVPLRRLTTLLNCIDSESIVPVRPQVDGPARALFIGTLGRSKGAYDFLDALSVLHGRGRETRAWVAGYDENEGDLGRLRERARALDLGESCNVVGTIGSTEKRRLLAAANVFVLPSYAEGLPMAMLEAMAAGLAVIATPVGGIPEVIDDGRNGFLVSPGDVEGLADKLDSMELQPALRATMGARNRELVEHDLDVKRYVARLVTLYETLVSQGHSE